MVISNIEDMLKYTRGKIQKVEKEYRPRSGMMPLLFLYTISNGKYAILKKRKKELEAELDLIEEDKRHLKLKEWRLITDDFIEEMRKNAEKARDSEKRYIRNIRRRKSQLPLI